MCIQQIAKAGLVQLSLAASGTQRSKEKKQNISLETGGMRPDSARLSWSSPATVNYCINKGWDVPRLIPGLSHLHPTFCQATT